MEKTFIGIDVGTQGVRGVAVTARGDILKSHSEPFREVNVAAVPGHKEQRPADWWMAVCLVLRALAPLAGGSAVVAIDGTSGTIVPLDKAGEAVGNAILYNDDRSGEQAARLSAAAREHERLHGYRFNPSFALPKIMWCLEHGVRAHRYVHQADYIVGRLTGEYGVTDISNALKTGYDLVREEWPAFVSAQVPNIPLPRVVPCGAAIGAVTQAAAEAVGLRPGTLVCAGATDGYASALAACAVKPGDWASILGTTLTLKGVTEKLVRDPEERIYSHKHPQGWWMPGGASNVGGRCLNEWFGPENFEKLNAQVARLTPTGEPVYPLLTPGERFPFVDKNFSGFRAQRGEEVSRQYAATLEGIGYVERMSYELLASLGCTVGETLYTTGGACRSRPWLQLRADILGKTLKIPAVTDAAIGSAMLAAGTEYFSSLTEAVARMGRISAIVEPDLGKKARYDECYGRFAEEVARRRERRV